MATDPETSTVDPRLAEDQHGPGDTQAPQGDWLFERAGEVFGPVGLAHLVALLEQDRIQAATRIRREGESWRALGSVPELVQPLREARMRARAAADARRAEQRARLNASARWTAWTLVIGAVVVVVAAGAAYLSVRRPWQARSELLADFAPSITLGATRVSQGRGRDGAGGIVVPDLRPNDGRRRPAPAAVNRREAGEPSRAARTEGAAPNRSGGDTLVAAQFDAGRIDQVLSRHRERLANCVREEARRSPDLLGEIPFEFAIGNDGRVVELWIDDPRLRTGPLRECLLSVLRAVPFEPFPGQRPVVSLSFRIGARPSASGVSPAR